MHPSVAAWAWWVAATPAKSELCGYVTAYRAAAMGIAMNPMTVTRATGSRGLAPGLCARSSGRGICARNLTRAIDRGRGRYRLATALGATQAGDAQPRGAREPTASRGGDTGKRGRHHQCPPG